MTNYKEVKISSAWTNIGLYGGMVVILAMVPVMVLVVQNQKFHIGMLIGGLVFLTLFGFFIYQFIYACDARVIGDQLVLKKQFRPAKSYSFDQIGYPTSFRYKSTKYVMVDMVNEDQTTEKYMIINSRGIFAFENKDAEQVLLQIREWKNQP